MIHPTSIHRRLVAVPFLLLFAVAAQFIACAGKKEPQPIPPQTTTRVEPQLEPPPQLPPPIRQVPPSRASTVKVIDPGGEEESGEPRSLYEASQLAKARQRTQGSQRPVAEITDENLHEYAEKAEVILVEGEPAAPAPLRIRVDPEKKQDAVRDEQYWRNRALEIRMSWRRTLDRIEELELESAALRQQFYAEDDPYLRDSQVKPAWDRVLDQLTQLRERTQQYEQDLDVFLEEGRRAGAEPGWLSEGWELEPENHDNRNVEKFEIHRSTDIPVTEKVKDP